MKQIDESRLESDIQYRYEYLKEFIGFGSEEAEAIQALAPYLGPLVPQLVEQTYEKLLAFDATARHFLPRQHGYTGAQPLNLAELSATHPQIRFRKDHLMRYLMQLLGRAGDSKLVTYLDMAGKIHTPQAGNKDIHVPLIQMNALMGVLSDIVLQAIAGLQLDAETRWRGQRAFNKLLWIQNDLINRHYTNSAVVKD